MFHYDTISKQPIFTFNNILWMVMDIPFLLSQKHILAWLRSMLQNTKQKRDTKTQNRNMIREAWNRNILQKDVTETSQCKQKIETWCKNWLRKQTSYKYWSWKHTACSKCDAEYFFTLYGTIVNKYFKEMWYWNKVQISCCYSTVVNNHVISSKLISPFDTPLIMF